MQPDLDSQEQVYAMNIDRASSVGDKWREPRKLGLGSSKGSSTFRYFSSHAMNTYFDQFAVHPLLLLTLISPVLVTHQYAENSQLSTLFQSLKVTLGRHFLRARQPV